MNKSRLLIAFTTACSLFIGSALVTARTTSTAAASGVHKPSETIVRGLTRAHQVPTSAAGARKLSSLTLRELAQARRATAKYHDVANAEADGYVNIDLYTPGEGFHYLNSRLIDETFNPEQPEVLLYASQPGEAGLKLVAVEYIVPNSLPVPEGFSGDDDVWISEEPFELWALNAWVWLTNPNGVFTFLNPRVP